MPATAIRKAKAAAQTSGRKATAPASDKTVKARTAPADRGAASPETIAAAISQYMATVIDSPELDAMFAEIDRNLDAAERRTARLLATQN
jgi:hypothetical protein